MLLSSHSARKTFAMLVYEKTKDILFVSLLLGHSNTEVTRNYLGLSDQMVNYNMEEIFDWENDDKNKSADQSEKTKTLAKQLQELYIEDNGKSESGAA